MKTLQTTLALTIAALLTGGASATAFTTDIQVKVNERAVPAAQRKLPEASEAKVRVTAPKRYLIQLDEPSVATYKGGIAGYAATSASVTGNERLKVGSQAVADYSSFVQQRQKEVFAAIAQKVPAVAMKQQMKLLLNAMVVEYDGDDLAQRLAGMPGVKGVHADREVFVQTDTSNGIIESPELWQRLGGQAQAGAGVNIAILDTGIDPDHIMFEDNGHTRPDLGVTDDYCATTPSFCNDKLVVARYFVPTGADLHPDEFANSPEDLDGHGTHVAGTAAGNPVSTTFNGVAVNFSGVAPGANLMVYKALWVNADGTTTGSSISLAQALEAAAADGADVINNSWGSLDNGVAPYEADIVRSIDEMGIINVAAAGNDGPTESSMGCPACIDEMFAVANTQTGRSFAVTMEHSDYTNAIPVLIGQGDFTISSPISGAFRTVKTDAPSNPLACSSFSSGLFTDEIVLVQRGTCTFEQKANNLQAAGARAMVLYNNVDGSISMDMASATLPSVSIDKVTGDQLEEEWTAGEQVTINPPERTINESAQDRLAVSSSRGPNRDSTILKPEVAAPGTGILSAYPGGQVALLSGTSMASPHVAGAAALLLDLKPSWTHQQIKSVLMTAANPAVKQSDNDNQATPHQVGAGRIDLAAAADSGISFDRAYLNNNACIGMCEFTRSVTNLTNSAQTWNVTATFDDPDMSATFPATFTLAANETKAFTISVNTAFAEAGWQYGGVTFTANSGGYSPARLPVAVYTSTSDDPRIISGSIASGAAVAGEAMQLQLRGGLGFTDGATTFSVALPTSSGIAVDYDTIDLQLKRSTQTALTVEETIGSVIWQGDQNDAPDVANIATTSGFAFAGMSLADVALSNDISISSVCSEGCDDLVAEVELEGDGATWSFDGIDHNVFSMWSNGVVELGASRALFTAVAADSFPDESEPNGIVAPFWTDLEFVNGDGEMNYAIVTEGSDTYLVLEWQNARSWVASGSTDSGVRFTFNVWFKLGTNEVIYNYVDVNSGTPTYKLSIGLENLRGNVGATHYSSASSIGSYPADGATLAASFTYGERAEVLMNVPVTVSNIGPLADATVTGTANQTVEVDFATATAELGREYVVLMNITSTDAGSPVEYAAQLPISIQPQGALSGVLVSQPAHGSATFTGATLSYTPDTDFTGSDSFNVRLVDEAGSPTATATVTVEVTNTAPVVSVDAPNSATSGDTVRLDASASSDADGDTLTYEWAVVSGSGISLSGANSATASFTAPTVTAATTVQVRVIVSDGFATAQQTVSVSITPPEKSSGALGWLMVLLALPLIWLRRRHA